jgi:tetratricopeptide (TPR) repeat protein
MTPLSAAADPRPVGDIALAFGAYQQGRLGDAEKSLSAILAAVPDHLDALHLLGLLRHQQQRNAEALELVGAVLKRAPHSGEACNNYGLILAALARHRDALAAFEKALATGAKGIAVRKNRAGSLKRLGRLVDALAAYEAIVGVKPDDADALNECGGLYLRLGRAAGAIDCYDRALALMPQAVALHINKGTAQSALNRFDEALESFNAAIAIDPECAEAHYDASLVRLRLGDFANGWRQYEWRWKKHEHAGKRPDFGAPLWLGQEPLKDKTIVLLAEQGYGDTIQFLRYVPLVAALGARVILGVQPPLKLLASGVAGVSLVLGEGERVPPADFYCPLLSLPLAFATELTTVPANIPYIRPQPECIAQWRAKLNGYRPADGRLRIGLCWSGSNVHLNDRNRSIPLERFAAILAVPDVDFVSVQKDVNPAHAAFLRRYNIVQLGQDFADFADTAAALAALDLVITVDTSVAHLAGAIGKAVALLLPFSPDFRWLLDRTDSPWYPTMRLYRQNAIGDWDTPLERLRQELAIVARRPVKPAQT